MAGKLYIQLDDLELREKDDALFSSEKWEKWRKYNCLKILRTVFPVLSWMQFYNWRLDLLRDTVAGITVGFGHIPLGMAYAMIANLEPTVGMYMGFFHGLVYFLFGSSKQISVGITSVMSLMVMKPILVIRTDNIFHVAEHVAGNFTNHTNPNIDVITGIQVATTIAFTASVIHLGMYVLHLGFIIRLMSDTVRSAFLTACAIQVIMLQLKELFGLNIWERKGYFQTIKLAYDSLIALPYANIAAVLISFLSIFVLVMFQTFMKLCFAKYTLFVVSADVVIMIVACMYTYFLKFPEEYQLAIIGKISSGLPAPQVPTFSIMKDVVVDAFCIAIVSFAITDYSGRFYARKLVYDTNSYQEILALGLCNLIGSFFSCLPCSASVYKSNDQFMAGGTTQITTLVKCVIILIVLFGIAPFFIYVPKCILASITVVTVKDTLLETQILLKLCNVCKVESSIWLITFLVATLVDVVIGLAIGIGLSIISMTYQSFMPNNYILGMLENSTTYLDVNRYEMVKEIEGIKIFHFVGCLNFATKVSFKEDLQKKIKFVPRKAFQLNKQRSIMGGINVEERYEFQHLILDLSAVTYIDPLGVNQLINVYNDFNKVNIEVYLVCSSGRVHEYIVRCDLHENKARTFMIFPTVHDAVLYIQAYLPNNLK